jgi:hypothetical protein
LFQINCELTTTKTEFVRRQGERKRSRSAELVVGGAGIDESVFFDVALLAVVLVLGQSILQRLVVR